MIIAALRMKKGGGKESAIQQPPYEQSPEQQPPYEQEPPAPTSEGDTLEP